MQNSVNAGQTAKTPFWKNLLFSTTLQDKNKSHKIAYIAGTTAVTVVTIMIFEFKFADVQFSLTIVVSALAGIVLGSLFGFVACFLGDLVGFLYNSGGFMYMPWVGISMGLVALISGLVVNGLKWKFKGALQVKLALVSVLTFALCTVAINTTAFWLLYSKVPYGTYLVARLFVQGQIWNSLFNYALLFLFVPVLKRIRPLGLNVG